MTSQRQRGESLQTVAWKGITAAKSITGRADLGSRTCALLENGDWLCLNRRVFGSGEGLTTQNGERDGGLSCR